MPALPSQEYVPEGFQQLKNLASVNIRTTIDSRERCCGGGMSYHVLNEDGDLVYSVLEDSNVCQRHIFGPHRPLFLSILNEVGDLVCLFVKPLRCDAAWVPCWMHKLMVQTPDEVAVGWIRQRFSLADAVLDIMNDDDEVAFQVKGGPSCAIRCTTEMTFGLYPEEEETPDGEISKFDAMVEDLPLDMSHEDFLIRFPEDATEKEKMLILGAGFLLNFMYFEIT